MKIFEQIDELADADATGDDEEGLDLMKDDIEVRAPTNYAFLKVRSGYEPVGEKNVPCAGDDVADLDRIKAIDDVGVENDVDGEGIYSGDIEDDFQGGSFA